MLQYFVVLGREKRMKG